MCVSDLWHGSGLKVINMYIGESNWEWGYSVIFIQSYVWWIDILTCATLDLRYWNWISVNAISWTSFEQAILCTMRKFILNLHMVLCFPFCLPFDTESSPHVQSLWWLDVCLQRLPGVEHHHVPGWPPTGADGGHRRSLWWVGGL